MTTDDGLLWGVTVELLTGKEISDCWRIRYKVFRTAHRVGATGRVGACRSLHASQCTRVGWLLVIGHSEVVGLR